MAERFVQSHIRNLPLFEQLSPPQLGVLANVVQMLRFEPGQLVVQEGQATQGLLLFVSGRGILTRIAPNGMEESIGSVETGQYVDEIALYNTGVETASLRVVESAIVLLIPRAPFVQLLASYPEIRANVRIQTGNAQAQTRDAAVKLFKGQRTDETVLQVWRRHWWAISQQIWLALVVAVVLFAIALLLAGQAPALALAAAGLAVVIPGIIIAYLYYDWQDDSVVLTDQRIVRIWHRVLAFETTINEMPLDQILEVNTMIPPGDIFARIFQYGTITVKTAGQGVNMILDMMPHPMGVQSMIFTQRDRFKERNEQRQRANVRNDVQQALGIADVVPSQQTDHPRTREENIGLPFIRTKYVASNGDLVYRKHSSIWIQHVFLPGLVILGALMFMFLSVIIPNFPLSGGVGLGAGMLLLILGAIWFYAADWDWRYDLFIIGTETITLIRQRPLWLQNVVERIRISQIDNVKSQVFGLTNNLLNRGDVKISLIGSDVKDAKVMDSIYDPQEVQAEISRRQAAIKSDRNQTDVDQQRQVIKEYLQTYHEIQQTQEAARVVPQQTAPPQAVPSQQSAPPLPPAQPLAPAQPAQSTQAIYPQATQQNIPPENQPLPPRDGIRPPRVPRARPD
ncbi:MAG: cyclic nucleotide-binding domain-containing protein [Chloroflexota bacterium]